MNTLLSSINPIISDRNNKNNKIKDVLPPIRFINYNDLKTLTSFPRYPDNANLCTNEDNIDRSKSLLIFISHCWLRGWSGAEGYDLRPHPDNAKHDKYKLILDGIDYLRRLAPGMDDVYVWIDYACINQNADPAGELKQLDKIVQSCDLMLTVIADSSDNEYKSWQLPSTISNWYTEYKAKAWNDGPFSYLARAWCRVEMMYAANVPLCSDVDSRIQQFTAGLAEAVKAHRRPHYLYGTYDKMKKGPPKGLPPLRNTFFEEYNPMKGSITRETDRVKIAELIEALKPYIAAHKVIVGYTGDRNAEGKMHGHGTYTFASAHIYTGDWQNDRKHGHGTYTYASGDVYVGEFRYDKMHGQGTYTYADGNVYVGEWSHNKIHGQGKYTYADGSVYVGEWSYTKRHGQGKYTHADGSVYVGDWRDGKMNGQGTYTLADGRVQKGTFQDGKYIGISSICSCSCCIS